jgi:hypothetical protein
MFGIFYSDILKINWRFSSKKYECFVEFWKLSCWPDCRSLSFMCAVVGTVRHVNILSHLRPMSRFSRPKWCNKDPDKKIGLRQPSVHLKTWRTNNWNKTAWGTKSEVPRDWDGSTMYHCTLLKPISTHSTKVQCTLYFSFPVRRKFSRGHLFAEQENYMGFTGRG